MSSAAADVAVVGGGPIGLAIAWRAAQSGLSVVLADPRPGEGAAWAAAGMLAPVTELHPGEGDLLALNLASAQRWPAFADELQDATGMAVGYRTEGTLTVARDRDDLEWLEDLHALQAAHGLAVERLSARDCRALEPALAPGIRGGLFASDDHQVDSRLLTAALLEACARAGVAVHRQETAVRVEGGRAVGLRLADGTAIDAPRTVLAAGAWSARIAGVPAGLVAVRPVKGQIVYLRGPADQPLARRNVRGVEVYLAPRADGRVAVGATMEERGFEAAPTAGAVYELLRAARSLLPGVDELWFDEVVVGWRPATPDNAPLLGPTELPGLLAATGHHRNGILLTPVTAEVLAACLADDALPSWCAPFDARRFARAGVA